MHILVFFLTILLLGLRSPQNALAQQGQASFGCSPSTGTFKVGDTFTVDYTINTRNNQVFGAEVYATYDTGLLEPVGSQSILVTNKTNWTSAVTNTIEATLGKIHLDYGSNQAAYTGSVPIGQVAFKAKKEGQAQFNFTFFQPNDNTTPGVAKIWGKLDGTNLSNILTNVTNCIYVVETAAVTTPTPTLVAATSTPTPTKAAIGGPTVVPTVSELPRSGRTEITYSLILFAVLMIGVGLIVPVKV